MTMGACAPSDCSGSPLSRLASSSVCLLVLVPFLPSLGYVVPCVPFSSSDALWRTSPASLSLSLFVVRVVSRGLSCACCRSVPWVILCLVPLSPRLSVRLGPRRSNADVLNALPIISTKQI